MSELTITKEAVLRAASKCSQARDVLKEMFPDAFKGCLNLRPLSMPDNHPYIFTSDKEAAAGVTRGFIQISAAGAYKDKAFYLAPTHDWKIERVGGDTLLIPTPK